MTEPSPDPTTLVEGLRQRVQRLERLVTAAYCLVVGAALVDKPTPSVPAGAVEERRFAGGSWRRGVERLVSPNP